MAKIQMLNCKLSKNGELVSRVGSRERNQHPRKQPVIYKWELERTIY